MSRAPQIEIQKRTCTNSKKKKKQQIQISGVPDLSIRQNDLPDHLFHKVKLILKDALEFRMEKDIAYYLRATRFKSKIFVNVGWLY